MSKQIARGLTCLVCMAGGAIVTSIATIVIAEVWFDRHDSDLKFSFMEALRMPGYLAGAAAGAALFVRSVRGSPTAQGIPRQRLLGLLFSAGMLALGYFGAFECATHRVLGGAFFGFLLGVLVLPCVGAAIYMLRGKGKQEQPPAPSGEGQ